VARVVSQRSSPPRPPGLVEFTMSVSPSGEMPGHHSFSGVFTAGPRLMGACQGSARDGRVEIQTSLIPRPPGLLDAKNSDRPSAESFGTLSGDALLTIGPRLRGVPHASAVLGTRRHPDVGAALTARAPAVEIQFQPVR
jgi:hypothetical protein